MATNPNLAGLAYVDFSIRKNYPGFSLDCAGLFERGVTAVFGRSGSGKTTLLDCIAGMEMPDEGTISVGGVRVYSSRARINVPPDRRRFGYVFQHGALFPHMTVRDNILYGYRLTPESDRRLRPEDLADLLGIAHLMDRGVDNLSGGERQRVALSRALAISPRLLLLDEPLASLDAAFRGTILTYLKNVAEQLDTPMIFVSHSLSEVLAIAPNTLALDDGKAVAFGPTSEVMAHPDVALFADYGTLENILEAEILDSGDSEGISRLRIGDVVLVGPPTDTSPGTGATVSVRAGDIILSLGVPPMTSARNAVPAVVRELREAGGRILVHVDVGVPMVAEVTPGSAIELGLRPGQDVHLVLKSNSIIVFRSDADPGAVRR